MSNAADGFFHVIYPTEALYNIERTADKIVWTYPLVLAVAAWDWLTSLDKERERIWKKRKYERSLPRIRMRCVRQAAWLCDRSRAIWLPVESGGKVQMLTASPHFGSQERGIDPLSPLTLLGSRRSNLPCHGVSGV